MNNKINIKKISFIAVYLSVIFVSKIIFGTIAGVEIVTSLFVFAGMVFDLPMLILLVTCFNLLIIPIYGIGTWWLMYWPIWMFAVVATYFLKKYLEKNIFMFMVWTGFLAFSLIFWFFIHDAIFFTMSFAIANLATALVPNLLGLVSNMFTSFFLFWMIPHFRKMYNFYESDKNKWK